MSSRCPDQPPERHRQRDRRDQLDAERDVEPPRQHRTERDHLRDGEVHQAGCGVDQRQPDRGQPDDQPELQASDGEPGSTVPGAASGPVRRGCAGLVVEPGTRRWRHRSRPSGKRTLLVPPWVSRSGRRARSGFFSSMPSGTRLRRSRRRRTPASAAGRGMSRRRRRFAADLVRHADDGPPIRENSAVYTMMTAPGTGTLATPAAGVYWTFPSPHRPHPTGHAPRSRR